MVLGKSTLLKNLNNLYKPDNGSIFFRWNEYKRKVKHLENWP